MATSKPRGQKRIGDQPLTRSQVTSRYRQKVGAVSVEISRELRDALKKIAAIEDSTLFDVLNQVAKRRIEEWEKQHGTAVLKLGSAKKRSGRP